MARCRRCGASRVEGAAFCSQCGARFDEGEVTAPPAAAAPAARETTGSFPLLARANLLRMRGRWQEAAALCAEVLRLEPGSASAYSLLGDIHENQGNLEEAIHWYDLALRVNPRSEADVAKKGRAQELLEARQRRAEWQAAVQRERVRPGAQALMREAVQRVIAIAGAALCGVVLVVAVLISAGERGHPPASNGVPTPNPTARPTPGPQITRSRREEAVLKTLSEKGATAGPHGHIDAVHIDPREADARVYLIVAARSVDLPTIPEIRERLERDALWTAHSVYRADPALRTVEVWVYADGSVGEGSSGREILFIGKVPADNLAVDPDARPPTAQDLPGFFERHTLYWHPTLSTLPDR